MFNKPIAMERLRNQEAQALLGELQQPPLRARVSGALSARPEALSSTI